MLTIIKIVNCDDACCLCCKYNCVDGNKVWDVGKVFLKIFSALSSLGT